MFEITYLQFYLIFTVIYLITRAALALHRKRLSLRGEGKHLLIYVCIVVIVRFTFFDMSTVEGKITPAIFDVNRIYPFRINLIPFVNLLDYPPDEFSNLLLNVVGNVVMMIPVGIALPVAYGKLNTFKRVFAAAFCSILSIEILQLLFETRVTDIDDLILNILGVCMGYGIYRMVKAAVWKNRSKNQSSGTQPLE